MLLHSRATVVVFGTLAIAAWAAPRADGQATVEVLARDLKNPIAVAVDADGNVFVTTCGTAGNPADKAVLRLDKAGPVALVTGLRGPQGMVSDGRSLFVTDDSRILRINAQGKCAVFVPDTAFRFRLHLNQIAVDPTNGMMYVTAYGVEAGGGLVYRVTPAGEVSVIFRRQHLSELPSILDAVLTDGLGNLLLADFQWGQLHRIALADGTAKRVAGGIGRGLARDGRGRLLACDEQNHEIRTVPLSGERPTVVARGFRFAVHIAVDHSRNRLFVPDSEAGTLTAVPLLPR